MFSLAVFLQGHVCRRSKAPLLFSPRSLLSDIFRLNLVLQKSDMLSSKLDKV